jgi:hypothetical protein
LRKDSRNLAYSQGLPENSFESFLKDFVNKSIKTDSIPKSTCYIYTIDVDYFIDTSDFCIEIANDFWLAKNKYVEAEYYIEIERTIFIIEASDRSRLIAQYLSFDEMDEATKQKIKNLFPLVTNWDEPYCYDFYCVDYP